MTADLYKGREPNYAFQVTHALAVALFAAASGLQSRGYEYIKWAKGSDANRQATITIAEYERQ